MSKRFRVIVKTLFGSRRPAIHPQINNRYFLKKCGSKSLDAIQGRQYKRLSKIIKMYEGLKISQVKKVQYLTICKCQSKIKLHIKQVYANFLVKQSIILSKSSSMDCRILSRRYFPLFSDFIIQKFLVRTFVSAQHKCEG